MAAELAQYDAKTVSVALDAHVVTGLAEDEFISIEYNADAFEIITGADGEVARSKINDSTATATLTLLQTSKSNDVLSAYYNADKLANTGTFTIFLRDQQGTTLVNGAKAWVQKPPPAAFAKSILPRPWTIAIADLKTFIGGSNA